jgi:beta-lactamase regulating signal transducer with metallopeptidase domain
MSAFLRCYPGDRVLDCWLVVALGVALVSSAAWLLSRRLGGKAALRHLVLLSGLIGCLACPPVAWLCAATGLTIFSFPVLRGKLDALASEGKPAEADPAWMPPRSSTDPPAVAANPSLPQTNPTIEQNSGGAAAAAPDEGPAISVASAPEGQGTPVSFRGIATGAMVIWASGAWMMLVRLAGKCGSVVRLRCSSRPLAKEDHRFLLSQVAARLGMRSVPRLLVSSRTVAPLAVGFGRPAIILPECLLAAISEDELRDVLVHEAAHLERGDQRIVLVQELAGALYWPIVSVHALNRELRRAREELCDNVVLACRDPIRYGNTLLHVAELLVGVRPTGAAAGIIGGPGQLEQRIAGLLDPGRNTQAAAGRKAACAVLFLFLAGAAIASATRLAASAVAAQSGAATPKPPAASDPEDPKFAGHFHGRVNGPDGKPLSGARVFIVPAHGVNKGIGPVRARTDADGRFEFDAPDMTYTELDGLPARREGFLIATADGCAPDWLHTWGHRTGWGFRTHWDPVKGTQVDLHLAKDDVPIHGRLLDPDGRPLAGARVRLDELMVPRGRDLNAHLDREKTRSIYMLVDYERDINPQILGLATEIRTDAGGRFTFTGLGRDRLAVLSVRAPGVADDSLTVMTRDAPDVLLPEHKTPRAIHGAGFTVQLKAGLTVQGLVRDRDTKAPIPGMWVTWRRDPRQDPSARADAPVTDEKGRFTITGLDPSLWTWDKSFRVLTAFSQPGGQYLLAEAFIERDGEVVIECKRGIPFRLKLVDEQGKPVPAEVEYRYISPNPYIEGLVSVLGHCDWPIMNSAARRGDGTYEGFVLPGPGAVLVKTPGRTYRPAHVDPKAFFAPGRTDWTAQDRISTYGSHNTLQIGPQWTDQHDYAAIVLVNPAQNSAPLVLSATVVNDRPRRVSLIDPEGQPVVGVKTEGLTWFPWDAEPMLRAASFPLTKLHPDRVRRITFVKEDRRLIGFLMARGDADTPYSVRMQPWGTATGRLVDENGKAISDVSGFVLGSSGGFDHNPDPGVGESAAVEIDSKGRFRMDQMIPGQRYTAEIYRGMGRFAGGVAFENLVVRPGEVRDLGDIRPKPPSAKE